MTSLQLSPGQGQSLHCSLDYANQKQGNFRVVSPQPCFFLAPWIEVKKNMPTGIWQAQNQHHNPQLKTESAPSIWKVWRFVSPLVLAPSPWMYWHFPEPSWNLLEPGNARSLSLQSQNKKQIQDEMTTPKTKTGCRINSVPESWKVCSTSDVYICMNVFRNVLEPTETSLAVLRTLTLDR